MTHAYANSWTSVRLPERDLAEIVLEVAAPLLDELGPAAPIQQARDVLMLAVSFWNASVRASKRWERRRVKELNELKKQLQGRRPAVPRRSISSPSASSRTGSIRGSWGTGPMTWIRPARGV